MAQALSACDIAAASTASVYAAKNRGGQLCPYKTKQAGCGAASVSSAYGIGGMRIRLDCSANAGTKYIWHKIAGYHFQLLSAYRSSKTSRHPVSKSQPSSSSISSSSVETSCFVGASTVASCCSSSSSSRSEDPSTSSLSSCSARLILRISGSSKKRSSFFIS